MAVDLVIDIENTPGALAEVASQGLLPGRVRLLFQPAEEVMPGGAVQLLEEGALDSVGRDGGDAERLAQAAEILVKLPTDAKKRKKISWTYSVTWIEEPTIKWASRWDSYLHTSFVREGDSVEAGQRVGLIRFGSRVDVYLPAGTGPRPRRSLSRAHSLVRT